MDFAEFKGEVFIPNVCQCFRAVYPEEESEDSTKYPCIKDLRGIILIIGNTDVALILCQLPALSH